MFLTLAGVVLATAIVGGGAAIASWRGSGPTTAPDAAPATDPDSKAGPDGETASSTASPATPEAPAPEKSPSPSVSPRVPESGPGTFTTARADGDRTGSGPLRRYSVQVEDGVDISAADAAADIQRILAHPRGWAAHGRGSFRLVSEGADFVIRIATPATADKLCLAQGLDTHRELNCETTEGVVVNLRRWVEGSPTFDGPPSEYRHLIINHEVGHEIGIRRHMGCGGPGQPAPVMMQQIKGLDGCRSNAWPYEEDGTYIEGPLI
ncbi:DUF3152 domain-containing protein [Streptomyces sp. NPDC012623]|uniref:DUF3152 domain-containing protein n=1 Tax=unclassified Streptomyces TaxID=2593676 RepID=UPI0036C08A15